MHKCCIAIFIFCMAQMLHAYELNGHFRSRPPAMTIQNQSPGGPISEIVNRALAAAGHTIVWSVVPWKRTQEMAKDGQIDFMPRHSMSEKRAEYLLPILMGYRRREVLFIIAPGKRIDIQRFEDLQKYVIGQRRGSFYSPLYNEAKNLQRVQVSTYEQLLNMVEGGRVDLAVVLSDNIEFRDRLLAIPGALIASYRIEILAGRYSSIPIKSPAAQYYEQINAAFFAMRKSGEMDAIFKQYGLEPFYQDFTTPESKQQEAMLRE